MMDILTQRAADACAEDMERQILSPYAGVGAWDRQPVPRNFTPNFKQRPTVLEFSVGVEYLRCPFEIDPILVKVGE